MSLATPLDAPCRCAAARATARITSRTSTRAFSRTITRTITRTISRTILIPKALAAALALTAAASLGAQAPSRAADSLAAIAVADSALAAITRGDAVALTDLMLPESRIQSAGMRQGRFAYGTRTREQERERGFGGTITERGFGATAQLAGAIAVVWVPYDLYVNGAWSHCGVDAFTMLHVDGRWRIANLAYSVEQPPACAKHPDGPPR